MAVGAAAGGIAPVAKIRGWASVGVDVERTGLAPTLAIPKALARSGLSLDQVDVVEINEAFATMAVACTRELGLDALVIPTLSGRSARLVSAHRPTVPIYALSPGRETVRRCGLMWGVQASWIRRHEVTEELILDAAATVVSLGWCQAGERVAITAGLPSGSPGTTSLLQIQVL